MAKKGRKKKPLLTKLEQDIAVLSRHRFEDPILDETRAGLCRAFITRDELSTLQKNLVYKLAKPIRTKAKKVRTLRNRENHFVYAISDGAFIKVGYAVDVQKRLKDLQVATPSELVLESKIRCPNRMAAKRLEDQIHRAGKKKGHHVRGEWFREEIMFLFDKKLASEAFPHESKG